MARSKSVVLTPAEKKAAVATVKADIKAQKAILANIAGDRKTAAKAVAAAQKADAATQKSLDKQAAVANKTLAGLEGKLAALTPAKEAA